MCAKAYDFHTAAGALLGKGLALLQSKEIVVALGWNSLGFLDAWDTMALTCLVPAQGLSLVSFVIVA